MVVFKSHGQAASHTQVTFISLKQLIYDRFVQIREFESQR